MMKTISILGSTGSIGTQALSVIEEMAGSFQVLSLSCGKNIRLLGEQIRKFHPKFVSVEDAGDAKTLAEEFADWDLEVSYGMDGLLAAAQMGADIVLTAVVGMVGIRPTIAAIEKGSDIALANKETMVCAGHIIQPMAREKGVKILPVDSEHSAIFQCLQGNADADIKRILLTASGGPFRGKSYEELEQVKVADALKHPNWNMGRKITIDSATMVNKGLEVMEARWLFDVLPNRIQVVVHPESIIHSAMEFADGAVMAQMGLPDMRLPIHYALCYPERGELSGEPLDLFSIGALHFEHPDLETFFGLQLAFDALLAGGNVPVVYNAANEAAVALFLGEKIAFTRIPELIMEAMSEVEFIQNPGVDEILHTEQLARAFVAEAVEEVL